jgi:hypothetical protein
MRELTKMELAEVSGGLDLFGAIGAGVLGAVALSLVGTAKGGVSGGSTGGILGVGAVAAAVTAVVGFVGGIVQGGLYGFVNGWDKTLTLFNSVTEQWGDQNISAPKV